MSMIKPLCTNLSQSFQLEKKHPFSAQKAGLRFTAYIVKLFRWSRNFPWSVRELFF